MIYSILFSYNISKFLFAITLKDSHIMADPLTSNLLNYITKES